MAIQLKEIIICYKVYIQHMHAWCDCKTNMDNIASPNKCTSSWMILGFAVHRPDFHLCKT